MVAHGQAAPGGLLEAPADQLRPVYRLVRPVAPTRETVRSDATQRMVVDHASGPLLVLGGPGTGKTTALVEAVAARVAAGADPERVLVLTFGRRAAAALRQRIARRLGLTLGRTIVEPLVRTFHAYAYGLLRRAAAETGEPPPRLLTGPEQDLAIRELLVADTRGESRVGWPAALRPALDTRGFAAELRDLLLRAAERGVSPDQLAGWGRTMGRDDWPAAARFARQYGDVLALRDATTRTAAYDTAELIRAAIGLLRDDPAFAARERARCTYVYVDELHDTDPAQLELLELVAGGGRHLVAFGDPDSSTFAFRGADPAGVGQFCDRFPTVTGESAASVAFDVCHRSTPALVAATRRVARRFKGPARHRRLRSGLGDDSGTGPEVRLFRSATQEATYVAHRLREAHLLGGVPWSRMAVVVRSTVRQLAGLQRALQQAGVPVATAAEDLPLRSQAAVRPLLLLLSCAIQPDRLDEDAAVALLHSPLGGADPLTERILRQQLRRLAHFGGDRRPSGVLLAEALRNPVELAAVPDRWATSARRLADLLAVARRALDRGGRAASVGDALWAVWRASGLAQRWSQVSAQGGQRGAAADRDLDAVVTLFDAASRFAERLPGAGPEVFLDHVLGQQIPADSLAPTADRGEAVRILTAHAAKGREWDLVAVPGVQEGVWPDLRVRGTLLGSELLVDAVAGRVPDVGDWPGAGPAGGVTVPTAALLDEERRLFYVAATRARRHLIVTAVASGDGEEQPSRFLDELTDPGQPAPSIAAHAELPRALTLPSLVAELRTVVADPHAAPGRRHAAARQLARLADAGVAGADPAQWWGLAPLSDDRPLASPTDRVDVSPSQLEMLQRCGLRWLLVSHGGDTRPGPERSVGTLVHAAAAAVLPMLPPHVEVDPAALSDYLERRFDELEFPARWLAPRERRRAEDMVRRLADWLGGNPRRLVATERAVRAALPGTDRNRPVEITGKVDRVEVDGDGRVVIVDLKTGKQPPPDAEVARDPQLAAYQVAVAHGGLDGASEVPDGATPGGAALVQLGTDRRRGPEQHQPAVGDADDPAWAERMVRDSAEAMGAAQFLAVANNRCEQCPVATCCPLSNRGRQVTE